jgi:Cytochrome C oxidase subunit II, periplasmic domain
LSLSQYQQLVVPEADVTLKVAGKQWYWTYSNAADQGGGFEFDSVVIPDSELMPACCRWATKRWCRSEMSFICK